MPGSILTPNPTKRHQEKQANFIINKYFSWEPRPEFQGQSLCCGRSWTRGTEICPRSWISCKSSAVRYWVRSDGCLPPLTCWFLCWRRRWRRRTASRTFAAVQWRAACFAGSEESPLLSHKIVAILESSLRNRPRSLISSINSCRTARSPRSFPSGCAEKMPSSTAKSSRWSCRSGLGWA